jgi:hypothetical protein
LRRLAKSRGKDGSNEGVERLTLLSAAAVVLSIGLSGRENEHFVTADGMTSSASGLRYGD